MVAQAHSFRRQQEQQRPSEQQDAQPRHGLLDLQNLVGNGALQEMLAQRSERSRSPGSQGRQRTGQLDRNPYAVYTTGKKGKGVVSERLPMDGSWDSGDWLPHHADRSNGWAADNIRDDKNQDLQAYDFTFSQTNRQGADVGSTLGVELIAPWDAKVIDIQTSFQGSGGYGKFIALENTATGLRVELHHLDSVGSFKKGQLVAGGTVVGKQGGSGNSRSEYGVHLDIVGTAGAVEEFVRANQTGRFTTGTAQR